jgi:hypothetical protein
LQFNTPIDLGAFEPTGNLVSIEVENYDTNLGQGFISGTTTHQQWDALADGLASGSAGLTVANAGEIRNNGQQQTYDPTADAPKLDYIVDFSQTGTYYVWARGKGDDSGNSIHVGLDGEMVTNANKIQFGSSGSANWLWDNSNAAGGLARLQINSVGKHTINAWMREDGVSIDKLILTKDAGYDPNTVNGGLGSTETARVAVPSSIAFSLESPVPAGMTIDSETGVITWTPTNGQVGSNDVNVRATKGDGEFTTQSFAINVANVNDAPTLDAIGNQVAVEGDLLTFTATAGDIDNPADTLTFSLDGGAPAGASISPSGVFTWTPAESQGPGTVNVTVRVTDDGTGNLDDSETIQITVSTPAPSADFDGSGLIDGLDFLQWQRGFGTGTVNADGDADHDEDVDGDDLVVWENQYGQPAPMMAAVFVSTPEESAASSFPASFFVTPGALGLGVSLTTTGQEPVAERAFTEPLDEAFDWGWNPIPEQNDGLGSDEFVLAATGDSAGAQDEAFALLSDDEALAGF